MSGHTPGPWVVYTPEDYDGPERLPGLGVESKTTGHAVVWFAMEPETGLANDADAELIASAPDLKADNDRLRAVNAELLEALETLVRYCSHNAMDELLPEGWQKTCHFREMLAAARAAIAKAKGDDHA